MKHASKNIIHILVLSIFIYGLSILSLNTTTRNNTSTDEMNYSTTAGVSSSMNDIFNVALEEAENEVTTVAAPLEDATILEDGTVIPAEFEPYEMYVNVSYLNVRSTPTTEEDNIIGKLNINDLVNVIGESGDMWLVIEYGDDIAYIASEFTQETLPELDTYNNEWSGPVLNSFHGTCNGPSGKETYYNLNMARVIYYAQQRGIYEKYWVRNDGTKMYGKYVCCACDLNKHPRGSLVETSLGMGIVLDTGDFTTNGSGVEIDIATTW